MERIFLFKLFLDDTIPGGMRIGLVTKVRYNDLLKVQFLYNDKGFRSKKISDNTDGLEIKSTYYVRDASGSTLAVYEANWGSLNTNPSAPPIYTEFATSLKELPIYGASRLGIYNKTTNNSNVYVLTEPYKEKRTHFLCPKL